MKKLPNKPFLTEPIAIVQIKRPNGLNRWENILWIYPNDVESAITLAPQLGNVTNIRVIKPKTK